MATDEREEQQFMAFLRNGCQQVGWPNYIQEIIIGALIVIAVALDRWRSSRTAIA